MSDAKVTIFVSTYNRLATLTRTLDSYRAFDTPYEVVLVDNGTDDPECVDHLEWEAQRPEVVQVFNLPKLRTILDLPTNLSKAMRDRYRWLDKPPWFAVTDADICFEGSSPETLDAYIRVFKATEDAAGPHLRVDASIPHGYPLRSRILATDSRLLYRKSMKIVARVPCSLWSIDTTFHLFPRMPEFKRSSGGQSAMDTLRCGPPYDAMHLDWYADITAPTRENEIYIADPAIISSWGGGWIQDFWLLFQNDPCEAFYAAQEAVQMNHQVDLRNELFILSWCFQHGYVPDEFPPEHHGFQSLQMLYAAIPPETPYWQHKEDWLKMIYDDDFRSLGWRKRVR